MNGSQLTIQYINMINFVIANIWIEVICQTLDAHPYCTNVEHSCI